MDPLSILTGVAGLVCTALKAIQTCNGYHGRYTSAAITMASMTAHCSCINLSLDEIQDAIIRNPAEIFRLRSETTFINHFMSVFGACQVVFSILNEKFTQLTDTSVNIHGELTKAAKFKYMWNDGEMKDLLRNLESQASAINLLLSALQMRSNFEITTFFSKRQTIHVLGKAAEDANSLASAEEARKRNSKLLMGSYCSSFDDAEFSFDYELINTTTYRRAFNSRSNPKSASVKEVDKIQEDEPDILGACESVREIPQLQQKLEESQSQPLSEQIEERRKSSATLEAALPDQVVWNLLTQKPIIEEVPLKMTPSKLEDNLFQFGLLSRPSTRKPSVTFQESKADDIGSKRSASIKSGYDSAILSIGFITHAPPSTSGFSKYTFGKVTQEQTRRNILQKVVSVRKVGSDEQLSMRLIPLVDIKATPLIAAAQKKDIHWEVEVLQKLSHPNIVRIQELIETSRAFGMAVNYDSPKTLAHFVQEVANALAPSSTKLIAYTLFRQLSSAVSFLHKNRIVHCDLTLENIVWCEHESRIVVTNLSMSKMIGFKRKRKSFADVQTFSAVREKDESILSSFTAKDLPFTKCSYRDMFFAAPELLKKPLPAYAKNRGITDVSVLALEAGKVDVYSCGVILFALLNGRLPFNFHTLTRRREAPVFIHGMFTPDRYLLQSIDEEQKLGFAKWVEVKARKLCRNMLAIDPGKRWDSGMVEGFFNENLGLGGRFLSKSDRLLGRWGVEEEARVGMMGEVMRKEE